MDCEINGRVQSIKDARVDEKVAVFRVMLSMWQASADDGSKM